MRLTPLTPGGPPRRDGEPARPAPAPGPAPDPGPLRADVLAPPFIVLAVAAGIAAALGAAMASALRGDWINLEGLGYVAAWGGYALYGALFLTLDARAARHLPGGIWPSWNAMWRATLGRAALALAGALGLGLFLLVVVSNMARARSSGTDPVIVGTGVLVGLWLLGAVVMNVRARRPTRIGL
jgi:hypothetical protein